MSAGSSSTERELDPWQFASVATTAAYAAAGLLAAWWRPSAAGVAVGGWLAILGIASGAYHMREWSIRALRLDQAAMYGTFVALSLHAATDHPLAWAFMMGAGTLVGWRLALEPARPVVVSMVILQPTMILLGGLTATLVLLEGTWWASVAAVALFGLAWLVWWRPWGHGVWHVLTAAAILLLFLGVR